MPVVPWRPTTRMTRPAFGWPCCWFAAAWVEEGTEHVRRYLDSKSANGKAWMLLGEALAMQQQMAEADMAIERAMQLDSSPIVLRQAMMHYMNSGRRERANAIMERLKLPSPAVIRPIGLVAQEIEQGLGVGATGGWLSVPARR